MNKEANLSEVIDIIEAKLLSGGTVTFSPNGTSMLPMLRDGEDVVVLSKPEGRLRLFDVALYRRKNGEYVMHRVVGFEPDGGYIMCGDNQFHYEKNVEPQSIVGVMSAFYRNGKSYTSSSFKYKLYIQWLYYTRFARHGYSFGKRKLSLLFKKGKDVKNEDEAQ